MSVVGHYLTAQVLIGPSLYKTLPRIDLSEVTTLKQVEFQIIGPDVPWVTATLETARSENLEQVIIHSFATFRGKIGETVLLKWRELDHLLARLWASNLIHPPRINLLKSQHPYHLGCCAPILLPELTSRKDELVLRSMERCDECSQLSTVERHDHCSIGIKLCALCYTPRRSDPF